MKHRVPHVPKRYLRIQLPVECADRLPFLRKLADADDRNSLFLRALKYFDRALCAESEGARVIIHHKNGSLEEMDAS